MQLGQHFRDAGIRPGIVRPAFFVFGPDDFPASLDRFVIMVAFRQNPEGQAARTVADKTPVTFKRMRRKTQRFQPGVSGAGDIG